jgi:alpha-tubulin suppressor-like RCC1 family protein
MNRLAWRTLLSAATAGFAGLGLGGCVTGNIPARQQPGADGSASVDGSTPEDGGTSAADGGGGGTEGSNLSDAGNTGVSPDGNGSSSGRDAATTLSDSSSDGAVGAGADSGSIADSADDAANPNAATAVSAGFGNACALTAGGGVKCWKGPVAATAPYPSLASGLTTVTTGGGLDGYVYDVDIFSCALTVSGGVECWGQNVDGELGNGSTQPSNGTIPVNVVPGLVMGLTSGATAVAAGARAVSACAVAGGGVKCWGVNGGALGNGSAAGSSPVPVPITGFTGTVSSVAVGGASLGSEFVCAIVSGGGVECWGTNSYGQLGSGTTTNSTIPVQVTGLTSGVTAVSTGTSTACAVTAGGGVQCWGFGGDGELGNLSTGNSSVPVAVMGLTSGVASVSTGGSSACALTTSGGVECWGLNSSGQLGNNSTTNSTTPVQVATLTSGVTAVSVGNAFACAVVSGGVWCWGAGYGMVPIHIAGFSG